MRLLSENVSITLYGTKFSLPESIFLLQITLAY